MTERKDIVVTNSQTVDSDSGNTSRRAISFDAAAFMHFLAETDWIDEEKAEYITIVWDIVCQFVALGFDVHPFQQAQKPCGELAEFGGESASIDSQVVDLCHSNLIEEFVRRNELETVPGGEGVSDG